MLKEDDTGFIAYQRYQAIKRHFTSSYDFFKYGGKTKVSRESFLKRKDRYSFAVLEKQHKLDLTNYILACFVSSKDPDKLWIKDLISDDATKQYYNWKKIQSNLFNYYVRDLNTINEISQENNLDIVQCLCLQPKLIFNLLKQDKILLETPTIFASQFNFVDYCDRRVDDLLWKHQYKTLIEKYKPFLKPTKKYKVAIKELLKN